MTSRAAVAAIERFERYRPPADLPKTGAVWPPRVAPLAWNGRRRDVVADAFHHDRDETLAAVDRILALGKRRRRALVSDFYNGLGCLLWGELYDQVTSISVRPAVQPVERADGQSVWFGRVGDMPFMYRMLTADRPIDALIIDGAMRYDLVMTLYYAVRLVMADGGLVAFFNTHVDEPDNHLPRFLDDLRSGAVDGIEHVFETIPRPPGGLGVAIEIIE